MDGEVVKVHILIFLLKKTRVLSLIPATVRHGSVFFRRGHKEVMQEDVSPSSH